MPPPPHSPPPGSPIEVLLDGRTVLLPPHVLKSIPAIRAQLELLAVRDNRVLTGVSVHNLSSGTPPVSAGLRVSGETTSFLHVAREITHLSRRQCRSLLAALGDAATLVLINDWPASVRLAHLLQTELRELLTRVSFLCELCDGVIIESAAGPRPLAARLTDLHAIQHSLGTAESQRDAFLLSDSFDQLASWLEQLNQYLQLLRECRQ